MNITEEHAAMREAINKVIQGLQYAVLTCAVGPECEHATSLDLAIRLLQDALPEERE